MAADRLRKGMKFLLLLPRTLPRFTAPALEVLHTLCLPDLSLGTSDGEQKGKGSYKRTVLIYIPSSGNASLLCMSRASPTYFSLEYAQVRQQLLSTMGSASAKGYLSSQPAEAPETLQQERVLFPKHQWGMQRPPAAPPKCSRR